MELQALGTTEILDSRPQYAHSTYGPEETNLDGDVAESNVDAAETGLIKSICSDDKSALVAHSKLLLERFLDPWDRSITSKLLHLCCKFDSADCAEVLLDGELGAVPLVNETNESGKSPLHTAAVHHAARCTELLLRKRARTDQRTKDGSAQVALEMALSSARLDVVWNPDDHCSIEDLVVRLREKDLTTIRLISERTKEVAEIALAKAFEGRIVALAALLAVAAERINDTTLGNTTVYERVVWEALSLGRKTTSFSPETTDDASCSETRKFLLSEIELLQLFGVVTQCHSRDNNVKSLGLLSRAVQVGDETVVALLLKTSIYIDEVDAEGNSALHYSVKTARALSLPEIKILMLLLKHGARVSQKNKLGLTALHLAAGNGHFQALQILLLEDPDCTKCKTEMKETPLFFAVKNDHMDCAELLLHWGANSEVFNLRQRPMDLAKSQDMRFMLSPTNIGLMNRGIPVQKKHTTSSQEEIFFDTCDKFPSMTNDETTSERSNSSAGSDICKFFNTPHGCVKGAKCAYSHSEEGIRTTKHKINHTRTPSAIELKKKIFVGGLPSSVNSALLWKYFEKTFGEVQDAKVLETQVGNQTQSRGFGFVTFKNEKHVSAAVQAHFVTIMDKQVEIKSLVPRRVLEYEYERLSAQQNSPGKMQKLQHQTSAMTCSATFEGEKAPKWLQVFNRWLPSLLQGLSKQSKEGEYALSSLKGDFREKFSLELDHVSLGYPKLSDFMKCYSDICCVKIFPIGRGVSPNHMILIPRSTINDGDNHSYYSNSTLEEISCGNHLSDRDCNEKQNQSVWFSPLDMPREDLSPFAQPNLIQQLNQDPLFHIFPRLQNSFNIVNDGNKISNAISGSAEEKARGHHQHKVLEAFAGRRQNSSVYFLREFDFYLNYYASVKEGKCFGCNEREVLWANFPCQHLLWCVNCKVQALLAAGSSVHKCVVCDAEVQKIELLSRQDYRHLVDQYIFHEEFPPLDSK